IHAKTLRLWESVQTWRCCVGNEFHTALPKVSARKRICRESSALMPELPRGRWPGYRPQRVLRYLRGEHRCEGKPCTPASCYQGEPLTPRSEQPGDTMPRKSGSQPPSKPTSVARAEPADTAGGRRFRSQS